MNIYIKRTQSNNPDFLMLIGKLDKELQSRYGGAQSTYDAFNKIKDIDTVVVLYDDNEAVGCGCFKPFGDHTMEIKRMFVREDYQGRGLSKLILKELETWARESGYKKAVLETGKKQVEAIGLYKSFGFGIIENYGQYKDMSESICFSKTLL